MPSLRQLVTDYALPVGAQVAGGILSRRAVGSATNNLAAGVDRSMDRITSGSERAERTMSDVYAEQKKTLAPFRTAGESTLPGLQEGVAKGGEFNKPFTMADFELYKDPGFQFRVQQGERAIKAGANAGGIRFSGATLKALGQFNQDSASQEAQAAYSRQQNDLSGRFGRVMDVAGIGERAAGAEVSAGSQYGANLSRLQQTTAAQLADLETDLASAQASGDIAKASAITDTISGILGTVENVGTARSMATLFGAGGTGTAATVGSGISGSALAAGGAATAAAVPGGLAAGGGALLGGGVAAPAALIGAPGAVVTGGVAGGTGAAGAGAGAGAGIGSTVAGLLTNPITIAAGAALGVGLLWRRSQSHQTANEWVKGTQNDFDKQMDAINRDAELTEENRAELKRAASIDYISSAMEFSRKKGGEGREVIGNAMRTFRQWYGDPGQFGFSGGAA